MSRKTRQLRKSSQRFEHLERRELLTGNVSVGVQNGQLLLLGDASSNGLTVVQLADFPGQPGTPGLLGNYLITPDATTQINQLAVGKSLLITGATAGMSASLGGGADNFQVTGRATSSIPAITVNSGAGDDVLTFLSCTTDSLQLKSPAGSDTVRISESTLGGNVDVTGAGNLDFSMDETLASSLYIKFDGSDLAAAKAYIKVTMQDCVVSSMVDVETDSSLDLSVADSALDRLYIKGDSSDTEYLKIKLTDILISSYAEVDAQGSGQLDFVAQGGSLEAAYIKFDGIDGQAAPRTRVEMDDVEVSSLLDIDAEGSIAMYAKGQHIKKATLFVRKSGSDQSDFIEVDELIDSSLSLVDDGTTVFDFQLQKGRADSVVVRRNLVAPAGAVQSSTIKLADVVISSLVDVEVDGGMDVSAARSKIDSFSIKQTTQSSSPPASIKIELEEVLVSGLVDVSTDGDLDLSAADSSVGDLALRCATGKHFTKVDLTASRAASIDVESGADTVVFSMTGGQADRIYMKGDSKDNFATSSVTFADALISSYLKVDFHSALDFSLSGGQVDQLSVHSSGGSAGKVSMQDFHFSSVDVSADASLEMALVDSQGSSVQVVVSSVDSTSLNFTKIKFDNARMSNALVVDVDGGLDLSLVSSACTDFSLGSSHASTAGGLGAGKVSLQDFHFASMVVQCDSSLDLAMVDTDGGSVAVDVSSVDGLSLNFTKIKFDNSRVSSSLVVDVDGDLDLSSTGSRFATGSVLASRKQGSSPPDYLKVQLENLLVSSFSLQSSSSDSSVSASDGELAALIVGGSSSSRGHHYSVKLTNARASSAVSVEVDDASSLEVSLDNSECALLDVSSSHASSAAGTGGGTGKVSMQDMHFTSTRVFDSGAFLEVDATGGQFDSMSIQGDGSSSYVIKLRDLLVSSLVDVDVDDSSSLDLSADNLQCASLAVSSSSAAGSGGGSGKVSMSSFSFSKVHVVYSTQSLDFTATGGQADEVSVTGEEHAKSLPYKVSFVDALVSSRVTVDVDGPLDFSCTGSSAADVSVSSSRQQGGSPTTYLKVELEDLLVSSFAVQDSDSASSVSVDGGQLSSFRVTAQDSPSSYTIKLREVLVSGLVDVDVDNDSVLDFSAVDSQCAALSVSSSHSSGSGGGTGKVSVQDFHFSSVSVHDDGASFAVSATGGQSNSLSIKGDSTVSSYTIKLADLFVSGLVDVDIDCDDALSFSAVDSQCALLSLSSSRAPVAGSGGGGGGSGKVVFQDMHFSSVQVDDDGALLAMSVSGGVASSASFQGSERSDGLTRSYKVHFDDLTLTSSVAVDAATSLDFSMDDCIAQSVHVGTTDPARLGKVFQKVELNRVVASGRVDVDSVGGLDLSADSCRSASLYIKFASAPPSQLPPAGDQSRVSLTNGRVSGSLSVLGGEGDDQVTLNKMFVSGPTAVSLAGGNDRLAVLDSIFAKMALFSGGDGTDELIVTRSRFSARPYQLGWESITS